MRIFKRSVLVLACMALAACDDNGSAAPADASPTQRLYGQVAFEPCTLEGSQTAANVEALCGKWSVAEDPARPQGRQIDLNIAWLPPKDNQLGTPDPVFFLAGGPGQAATEVAGAIYGSLSEVLKKRDVILIDQRGTGGSNSLACVDAQGQPLAFDEDAGISLQAVRDWASQCHAGLEGRADTRFYTTAQAITDLDAVRQALGVAQVNLIGGSYGTRVAQQYAARYPQQTRSVILDGVVPNDLVVGAEFAQTFQRAISMQSQLCQADAACAKRFPEDLLSQLEQVVGGLREQPRQVGFRDPATAQWHSESLSADAVTGLAFAFSYLPQASALLPVVLDEARAGRYESLAALSRLASGNMSESINRGMQWSVICAEDFHRKGEVPAVQTLLGPETVEYMYAACPVWPHVAADAATTAPLASDLPALLLSGEVDPVTPPAYGEAVLKQLPHGRHLVARGQGHGTLGVGCMPGLLAQFLDSTDAAALDASCLDNLRPVLPFTSFNGWEP